MGCTSDNGATVCRVLFVAFLSGMPIWPGTKTRVMHKCVSQQLIVSGSLLASLDKHRALAQSSSVVRQIRGQ
jgi:hypothetical protein